MSGKIGFLLSELADIYALQNLFHHLPNEIQSNIAFIGSHKILEQYREKLEGYPMQDSPSLLTGYVGVIRDVGKSGAELVGSVNIDLALLRCLAVPLDEKEKAGLRDKYQIPSDRPVVVIGRASHLNHEETIRIAQELSEDAYVVLVGNTPPNYFPLLGIVRFETRYGVLMDYYALSDANIDTSYLAPRSSPLYCIGFLHNFIEATEGGPLFMLPQVNSIQFGYRELVEAGSIVECTDLDDIILNAMYHLHNPTAMEHAQKKRSGFLTDTQERYLPVILAHIQRLLGHAVQIPSSDLVQTNTAQGVDLMHPDTKDWGSTEKSNKNLSSKGGIKFPSEYYIIEKYNSIKEEKKDNSNKNYSD